MKSTILFVIICSLVVSGCCSVPSRSGAKIARVNEVLDAVKNELNAYALTKTTVVPNYGDCHTKGSPPITFTPTKVTLKLRTVATNTNEPSVGLSAPLGVISFDPSYSGSYSRSRTQALEIPLNVESLTKTRELDPGEHPLADAIAEFRDSLLKVDHAKTPCLSYNEKNIFKLSLAFDVVNKTSAGVALKLAVFKIGDKQTFTDEAHQVLDLEFTMGNGLLLN